MTPHLIPTSVDKLTVDMDYGTPRACSPILLPVESPPHLLGSENVCAVNADKQRGDEQSCDHGQNIRRRPTAAVGPLVTFMLGLFLTDIVNITVSSLQNLDADAGLGTVPIPASPAYAFDKEHSVIPRASPPSDSFLQRYHTQPSDAISSGFITHYD